MRRNIVTYIAFISMFCFSCMPTPIAIHSDSSVLSIDVENFRGGKPFAFLLCWDDGVDDLQFSFIEDEIGFKHTSFVATSRLQEKRLWGLDMLFRGHDIQSHSFEHLHLNLLNHTYCRFQMEQSKIDLERYFGYTPILFAYPYGATNSYVRSEVLEYYRLARSIAFEEGTSLGQWPITDLAFTHHSFPDADGLSESNLQMLTESFEEMVSKSSENPLAYKAYGHTQLFSEESMDDFQEALRSISQRDDTWITSWGEAVGYQIQKDYLVLSEHTFSDTTISFNVRVPEQHNFGIPLTYRIEIPEDWDEVTVYDGGKISDKFSIGHDGEHKYILLDSIPHRQTISIQRGLSDDDDAPLIKNLRTIVTMEGVAFLVDVSDTSSLISDVNITITGNGSRYHFDNVQNPVFWSNSTYGRVLFGITDGCYQVMVTAKDAMGNFQQFSLNFEIKPTHRTDLTH